MADRLEQLKNLPERRVVGLNCGTSLDGVDAALVRMKGSGFDVQWVVQEFIVHEFSDRLRRRLSRILDADVAELAELDMELGRTFADAVDALMARTNGVESADLIGSHGVTAYHRPPRRRGDPGATLQIGDLAVIAERTGVVTCGDFRTGDVAAGGHGAPLAPYLDWLLCRDDPGVLLLNLGGIANLTFVGPSLEEVIAFDVGPANMPLDAVARRLTNGVDGWDDGGRLAALGRVDEILLDHLLALPFIVATPPKTTGREEFGEAFAQDILRRYHHLRLVDILATLTAFCARAVRTACAEWVEPHGALRRVVVSGGGVHNLTLMHALEREFAPVPVEPMGVSICDPDAKEALLFAVLANERLFGRPTSVPSATGAAWPVSLGKVVY